MFIILVIINIQNQTNGESDFSIIYTLDNYITIQGIVNGEFVYDNGYLYSIADSPDAAESGRGLYKYPNQNKYNYMGVDFEESDTEELKEYVGENEFHYPEKDVKLIFYKAELISAKVKLLEHEDYKWIKIEEFSKYDFAEADKKVFEWLK